MVLALLVTFFPNVKPVLHFVFKVRDTSLGSYDTKAVTKNKAYSPGAYVVKMGSREHEC